MNQPPESIALLDRAASAFDRGLAFLDSKVSPQGLWECHMHLIAQPDKNVQEHNPFVGALGALTLNGVEDTRAKDIVARSKRLTLQAMEYPGLWRYWRNLPRDVDSTSICSLALGAHPWLLSGWNQERILQNLDDHGRIHTWLVDGKIDTVDADAVVNANAIAYLGDTPRTKKTQDWLLSLLEQGDEQSALHYYWEPMDFYLAMARAIEIHGTVFAGGRALLISRIEACRQADGGYGEGLCTVLALLALYALGSPPAHEHLRVSLGRSVDGQQDDGGWPSTRLFSGPLWPNPREYVFHSRAFNTACRLALIDKAMPALGE